MLISFRSHSLFLAIFYSLFSSMQFFPILAIFDNYLRTFWSVGELRSCLASYF